MQEFLVLIGQILIITCIQTISEMIVDPSKNPGQVRIINIACFAGGLYLLFEFVFNVVLQEITTVINFQF